MKANWKQVSNSEAQVPVFATNASLEWVPLPGEKFIDHIRRMILIHERLLSSCNGARSASIEDYRFNQRRLTYNPRNKSKRTGPRTWGVGLAPEPARPKGRALNNEKEPANA